VSLAQRKRDVHTHQELRDTYFEGTASTSCAGF
jgi:hypothetical protein